MIDVCAWSAVTCLAVYAVGAVLAFFAALALVRSDDDD